MALAGIIKPRTKTIPRMETMGYLLTILLNSWVFLKNALKLGYSSKSLNNLLSNQSIEFQNQIKDWWGKKLAISIFWLLPSSIALGVVIGLMVGGCKP